MAYFGFTAYLFLLIFFATLFTGCLSPSPQQGILMKGTMEVVPAPDVHGANNEIKPNSSIVIISGGGRIGDKEKVKTNEKIENDLSKSRFSADCEKCGARTDFDDSYKFADLFYEVTSERIYGTVHVISKKDLVDFGFGLGYDDFLYLSGSMGINTKYFEVGATVALGAKLFETNHEEGYAVGCDYVYGCNESTCNSRTDVVPREKKYTDFYTDSFGIISPGFYASVYWGGFFFNYSGSIYWPKNTFDGGNLGNDNYVVKIKENYLPAVITQHFSLGYRFRNGIGLRAGATNVVGDFEGWHWSGFGGVEIVLF